MAESAFSFSAFQLFSFSFMGNLEVPLRTTRLRGSLPIRRAQVCLGFLYRTLKHTYKPPVRAAVRGQERHVHSDGAVGTRSARQNVGCPHPASLSCFIMRLPRILYAHCAHEPIRFMGRIAGDSGSHAQHRERRAGLLFVVSAESISLLDFQECVKRLHTFRQTTQCAKWNLCWKMN